MTTKKQPRTPLTLTIFRLIFKVGSPLMPDAMASLALKLWCTPPKYPMPAFERACVKKAKVGFIEVGHLKIRTFSWGEGPAVLFIHGWGGRGSQASYFVEALNQAGFRVVSIDLPAHGESVGSKTAAPEMVLVLQDVVKQIDGLHSVITHSVGGLLLSYLDRSALEIKSIAFISPPASIAKAVVHFAKDLLQLPPTVNQRFLGIIDALLSKAGLGRFSLLDQAPRITQPVLIVIDENDDVTPLDDAKDIASKIKQCTFCQTEGLGHRRILRDKTTIERVVEFVSQNS